MKRILIVDVNPERLKTISGVIEKESGLCEVYTAQDGNEAVDIIHKTNLDLVITGLEIHGMDVFELLTFINTDFPHIKVIIMADRKSKLVTARIKEMGGVVFSENKMDLNTLSRRVFTDLQIDIGGKIQGISLPSFLQMLELEGKSCNLSVVSGSKKGFLYLLDGKLIAAKTGKLSGKEAALEIIGWDQVLIEIDYSPSNVKQQFDVPLMRILLESRRRIDEKRSQGNQKRAHDRYECLVAVDYDIEDWAYQSNIKNISLGGAFIEVNQPVRLGEEIVLTLTTGNPARTCNITGTIMRRDGKGIGVKFNELSLLQMAMVEMIIKNKEEN